MGKNKRAFSLIACLGLAGTFTGESAVLGAEPPLSRDMQLGIYYFKHGEDSQAMDRFVETLNQGSPSERTLANQYLNRITQRMAGGGATAHDNGKSATPTAPAKAKSPPVPIQRKNKEILTEPVKENFSKTTVSSSKAISTPAKAQLTPLKENPVLLKAQIEGKIKNMSRMGLREIHALPGVVIATHKDGRPLAIAVPSGDLFRSKITFRRHAEKIISALSSTIYGEGKAKILIFPKGAVLGDVKVIDMRRAVAIADSLVASGIAPSRVQAELLTGGSYKIPKRFLLFKGIIFIFAYGQTLDLKAPPDEDGPPLSLGVSASHFRVDRGEGSLIEFSVEEPVSGVHFWKFKILRPGKIKANVLDEVVGSGPVFHQVYWDGRKNYSGPHQPYGSYECLLTAEDGAGRMRAIHRWIEIKGPAGTGAEAVGTKTAETPPAAPQRRKEHKMGPKAPTKKSIAVSLAPVKKPLQGSKRVTYVEISTKNRGQRTKINLRTKSHGPVVKKENSSIAAFEILFKPGTYQMEESSKKNLLSLARKMAKQGKARYDIIGYAKPSEKNAKNLCRLRAQVVAGLLINKYRISIKRLRVKTALSDSGKPRVAVKRRGGVVKWKKKK